MLTHVPYGITARLPNTSMDDAIARTTAALATEGFGVLTTIDLAGTFQKKLGVERAPYVILGACNPKLAHAAIAIDPGFGLLLPCNVAVAQADDGAVEVSAVDPASLIHATGRDDLGELAGEVKARLSRVIASLQG